MEVREIDDVRPFLTGVSSGQIVCPGLRNSIRCSRSQDLQRCMSPKVARTARACEVIAMPSTFSLAFSHIAVGILLNYEIKYFFLFPGAL